MSMAINATIKTPTKISLPGVNIAANISVLSGKNLFKVLV